MSLTPPTTATLADDIVSQIESSLEDTVPLLPKAFIRVLAKVLAGVVVILYRYAGWIYLQMFSATASSRETTINGRTTTPLVECGRRAGAGEPLPATRAELVITVTVLSQTGSLPANAQCVFSPRGVLFLTTAAVELNAPTVPVRIRAVSGPNGSDGSGTIGNLEPGAVVTFASPLPSIARDAVVASQAVTGAPGETWDAYRARVIRREQRRPQGGAYADYQAWAEGVPGIVAAYPYTGAPGEVDVYVEATEESSGSPDGIPTGAQLSAVLDAINFDAVDGRATRRNVNAAVNALAITRTAFDITVVGLEATDVPAARAAISSAVDEFLRTREPFIVGLSVLPRLDRITLASVSGVADEAASAVGATIAAVTLELGGIPITAFTLGDGERAKLGTPTFT